MRNCRGPQMWWYPSLSRPWEVSQTQTNTTCHCRLTTVGWTVPRSKGGARDAQQGQVRVTSKLITCLPWLCVWDNKTGVIAPFLNEVLFHFFFFFNLKMRKSLSEVNKTKCKPGHSSLVSASFGLFVCAHDAMCVLIACFAGDSLSAICVCGPVCLCGQLACGRAFWELFSISFCVVCFMLLYYCESQRARGVHIYSIFNTNCHLL